MNKVSELITKLNTPIKRNFADRVNEVLGNTTGKNVKEELNYAGILYGKKFLESVGEDLSEIINQDGDDKNDGEIIDEIVKYLKELKIYQERK